MLGNPYIDESNMAYTKSYLTDTENKNFYQNALHWMKVWFFSVFLLSKTVCAKVKNKNKCQNSKVKGFINRVEKDIAPIMNAISFPYSYGFVEGNNKFKLIKYFLYEGN